MSERAKRICKLGSGLVLVALVVTSAVLVVGTATAPRVEAWATPPCDFLTGGGWIVHNGAKANFGVGGGCKHGSPTWGHLEYIDHSTGLNVHWTSITVLLPRRWHRHGPEDGPADWDAGHLRNGQDKPVR